MNLETFAQNNPVLKAWSDKYPYIKYFGIIRDEITSKVEDRVRLAISQEAPQDACYWCYEYGWITLGQLNEADQKEIQLISDRFSLLARFERTKASLTEQWAEQGIQTPPTDKEVWGQMRAVAMRNMDDARVDDMQDHVEMYQKRIAMIDEIAKEL